jgi:hypothetical protein
MSISLHRKVIVQFYCLFSEAERSLHRLLDPAAPWSEFQQYYSCQKRESLRRALGFLTRRIPCSVEDFPGPSKEEMNKTVCPPGLLRVLCGRWLARWKTSWTFSIPEIHWLALTGQTFLDCLEKMDKPNTDLLISLRQDFYLCQTILAYRCIGMREIEQSKPIGHFRQTEWLKTIPVADFFDEAA